MKTNHRILFQDSKVMNEIPSASIDLVVTSPPYPMIEMWDGLFFDMNQKIQAALEAGEGKKAFDLMHQELDPVWNEIFRVLKIGGIACINIGDATRSLDNQFALYANHSRIQRTMIELGFSSLPAIIWRKQTNAPNKFMGSGVMPPGAYVTLEHEYIILFRKGPKREFLSEQERSLRLESAFFWEERNEWFSDIWFDLKGVTQNLKRDKTRLRSGAYPFELPYRLINMFSVKGDWVLDPFLGLGTTLHASMASCRNSIGIEIEPGFRNAIFSKIHSIPITSNQRITERLKRHLDFVKTRFEQKGAFKYKNRYYGFPVVTRQEVDLLFNQLISVHSVEENELVLDYSNIPQKEFCNDWESMIKGSTQSSCENQTKSPRDRSN